MWDLFPLVLFMLAGLGESHRLVGNDEVTNLPGLTFKPDFKHYSGYLPATGGRMLHYWFVESERSPANDPVVLWLNGGPGCSSMDGMLTEHGPFRVNTDGSKILPNPYSWNKISNMLYLEAPAGVGYSYSPDKNYTTDDDMVAENNHEALKSFFKMYSQYASSELYLTGESYAGIYIPTLANLVMQDSSMNFKGIAVGNGMSDYNLNDKSLMYFGYFHGLWGRALEQKLVKYCCKNANLTDCDFGPGSSKDCQAAAREAGAVIGQLNVYNMYAECYQGPQYDNRTHQPSTAIMLRGSAFFQQQATKFFALKKTEDVGLSPPCVDGRGITTYMNRADVRQALHIADHLPEWALCSDVVGSHYIRTYTSMRKQYLRLLGEQKYRVLVYNGDIDMACNFLMDQWFADSLGLRVVDEYRAWQYKAADGSQQVGGYVKHFDGLTFATVRGAGHMVPTDKPVPAYAMFEAFLGNKRL